MGLKLFFDETKVAMSSRSPSDKLDGPRSKSCVSALIGSADSFRYSSSPVIPDKCSGNGR